MTNETINLNLLKTTLKLYIKIPKLKYYLLQHANISKELLFIIILRFGNILHLNFILFVPSKCIIRYIIHFNNNQTTFRHYNNYIIFFVDNIEINVIT